MTIDNLKVERIGSGAGALFCAFMLAGCQATVENVRQQVTGDYPVQTRTFQSDEKATYAAARTALKQMDFRLTHGGLNQGEMDASSGISPGDNVGSSHQFLLKAHFQASLDGKGTDVVVRLSEVVEPDSQNHLGQGVESPLRDTSMAEVFFRDIQLNLSDPAAGNREQALGAPVAR